MAILHYYVDWDNDGNFGHPNSDITQYVMPASWRFGRNAAHEYDSAGTASLTLDNSSSIFSSFNAASPLYGKIVPNIRVRVTMTSGDINDHDVPGLSRIYRSDSRDGPGNQAEYRRLRSSGSIQ